ncbi:MAG: hypothetical protein VW175_09045, partial [Alphaproteobacteria bacterium]
MLAMISLRCSSWLIFCAGHWHSHAMRSNQNLSVWVDQEKGPAPKCEASLQVALQGEINCSLWC